MIVIKHGHRPEPKRWKFVCSCGCEWIADEFEAARVYSYQDVCNYSLTHYHAVSLVYSKCLISSEEYEKIYNKAFNEVGLQLIKITKEELY